MKIKIIEILIVVAILFLVAAVIGCKDEDYTTFDFCRHEGLRKSLTTMWKCKECGAFVDSRERELWAETATELVEPIESIHISMMDDNGKGFNKTYIGTESEIRKNLIKDGVIEEPNEPNEVSLQELLIKPPTEWIEKYGDGIESQQTANIVLAIQVINRQGEAIKQLDKRLAAIEIPKEAVVIIDPNGVK